LSSRSESVWSTPHCSLRATSRAASVPSLYSERPVAPRSWWGAWRRGTHGQSARSQASWAASARREIAGIVYGNPTREEVVAELLHCIRDTVAEMGEQRATGFLKKFYGWYPGRGRFPKPFANELVRLETIEQVEERLLAAAPGANDVLARLEAELPTADNV